jgi:hypothetical protein
MNLNAAANFRELTLIKIMDWIKSIKIIRENLRELAACKSK